MGGDRRERAGIVLVEFHSDGLVAARAAEAMARGHDVVIADNSGEYCGSGNVVHTGGNVGFGAACDAAVAALDPAVDVLVLQNPDAFISQDDLDLLIAEVRNGPWVALAPSLHADRVRRSGFAVPGPMREVALVALDCLRLRRPPRGRSSAAGQRPPVRRAPESPRLPVHAPGRFASAALLVVDRHAYDQTGGFDHRYYLYVEDLDLWDRLARFGPVGFVPGTVAYHSSGTGSTGSATRRTLLRWLGRELYAAEHNGAWLWTRCLHRAGAVTLPSTDDPVVDHIVAGLRSRMSPAALQAEVRELMESDAMVLGGRSARSALRAGWSRTRLAVGADTLVLDVGSGAFPNARADVLCERSLVRDHRIAVTDRPTVVADAEALPFRSGSFELAIASHLAEHVDRPDILCQELVRVAQRAYVETPSPAFERLFPASNHRWVVRRRSSDVLEFSENLRPQDAWTRLGDRLRPWYYAGTDTGWRRSGLLGRGIAFAAYALRGLLNRSGVVVTRVVLDSGWDVDVRVAGLPQARPEHTGAAGE